MGLMAAALLAGGAADAAARPVDDGGGPTTTKVRSLKGWKSTNAYRVQTSFMVRREQSLDAPRTGTKIVRGTWLQIACQVRAGGRLWDRVAGGFVPDSVMKTYTDGRLRGAPRCRLPHPDRVWTLRRWRKSLKYRVTEAQTPQREPRLGTGLGTVVEDNQWVRIVCQTVGQKVRGSRLWNRIGPGGYIPDSTMKTYTDGRLRGAPRCKGVKRERPRYVALGDSFSSGLGGDGYYPRSSPNALVFKHDYLKGEPPGRAKDCYRNRHAYSRILAGRLSKRWIHSAPSTFLACQGDTTDEVLSLQIPNIPRNTRLVTLTIGGNDMGFAEIVRVCATPGANCSAKVAERFGRNGEKLAQLGSRLDRVLWRLREKAPYATVVMAGYPALFAPAKDVSSCGGIDTDDAKLLNRAGRRLNATIRAAVGRYKDVRYAGLGKRFDGHGPCQRASRRIWINPVTAAGERQKFSMHPNLRGQQEYARAIVASSPGLFR